MGQAYEIYRRWSMRRHGLRVSLGYVLTYLDHASAKTNQSKPDGEDDTCINVESMMSKVPGLGQTQATRILTNAQMYIDDQEHKSQSISEAMIDIQRMSS